MPNLDDTEQSHQRYFDDVLHSVDRSRHGSKMLNTITDGASAAAFADVLFREGRATGTAMIERAVNKTINSLPNTERRRLGLVSLSVDKQMEHRCSTPINRWPTADMARNFATILETKGNQVPIKTKYPESITSDNPPTL